MLSSLFCEVEDKANPQRLRIMQRHTVIKCGHGSVRMKEKSVLDSVSRIFRRGGFWEWAHCLIKGHRNLPVGRSVEKLPMKSCGL